MSISKSDTIAARGIGVFVRGKPTELDEAAGREQDATTTFRSQKVWRAVENALDWRDDEIVVYFCPARERHIQYTAILEDILIYPDRRNDQTDSYLQRQLDSQRESGNGPGDEDVSVNTLYQVSRVTPLEEPFPFTELKKLSDGEPLDPEYSYSYAIVREHE